MSKANVGDLIRITKGSGWYADKVGEIYEVIDGRNYGFSYPGDRDYVYVDHPDNSRNVTNFVRDCEYVIHRKAGEEDTPIRNPHPEYFAEPMGNEVGASINGKLLRTYTGTDVEGDFHTHVTVGIDEATGVMYVLGMKTEVVE